MQCCYLSICVLIFSSVFSFGSRIYHSRLNALGTKKPTPKNGVDLRIRFLDRVSWAWGSLAGIDQFDVTNWSLEVIKTTDRGCSWHETRCHLPSVNPLYTCTGRLVFEYAHRLNDKLLLFRNSLNTTFLPARRYASAGNSDRNVSVCPSVCHAPVLCQNEES